MSKAVLVLEDGRVFTGTSFGAIGERLLISPRFHRAHHGLLAAGQRSCNYGAVLPWWDMLFGTADFSREYVPTGDPSGEEALASGSYLRQQWAGLRRFADMAARLGLAPEGVSLVFHRRRDLTPRR